MCRTKQKFCEHLSAHMVSVNNEGESAFLSSFLDDYKCKHVHLFIYLFIYSVCWLVGLLYWCVICLFSNLIVGSKMKVWIFLLLCPKTWHIYVVNTSVHLMLTFFRPLSLAGDHRWTRRRSVGVARHERRLYLLQLVSWATGRPPHEQLCRHQCGSSV